MEERGHLPLNFLSEAELEKIQIGEIRLRHLQHLGPLHGVPEHRRLEAEVEARSVCFLVQVEGDSAGREVVKRQEHLVEVRGEVDFGSVLGTVV